MDVTAHTTDSNTQLRALYQSLLSKHEHFEEFKRLLSLYRVDANHAADESAEAAHIRKTLNERVRGWIGPFSGLSASDALLWRAILLEERFSVAISPSSDANGE